MCQVLMDVDIQILEILHPLDHSAVYGYWGVCTPPPPVIHDDLCLGTWVHIPFLFLPKVEAKLQRMLALGIMEGVTELTD